MHYNTLPFGTNTQRVTLHISTDGIRMVEQEHIRPETLEDLLLCIGLISFPPVSPLSISLILSKCFLGMNGWFHCCQGNANEV